MEKHIIKNYPITGMSCATCAMNVEKALTRQPGVTKATVNYANNTAVVELDPSVAKDTNLQTAIRSIGYDLIYEDTVDAAKSRRQSDDRTLKINVIGSLALSVPVVILSMFYMNLPYVNWIMLALTLPVVIWFGRSFFIHAVKLARHRQANMDTLVALSTGIAFLFSLFNTLFPEFWISRSLHPHVYYEASSVIIAFILVGKLLEEKAKSKTSAAIKNLMGLQPEMAIRLDENGKEQTVSISGVTFDDLLLVRPGDRIPVDGTIKSGNSSIDESSITGESIPVDKSTGDTVYAGTININGSFIIIARKVGSQTILSQIIEMVQKAQSSKAPVQKIADKVASVFVPVVMVISFVSFIAWLLLAQENALSQAFMAMVTVLVIACPCALGLATPTAIMVGMGKGAKNGILIKDSESLEIAHRINVVILDKTGTLTEGKPVVTDLIWTQKNHTEVHERVLYSMERQSAHPLANSIVEFMGNSLPASLQSFEYFAGKGIEVVYKDIHYFAGNPKWILQVGPMITDADKKNIETLQEEGKTVVLFTTDTELMAVIALADPLKPGSADAVHQLRKQNIEVHMLTGDHERTAQAIAKQTGISSFRAHMLPGDKADYIKELQSKGKIVAMVGDGINDAQAMAESQIAIAMGKGSDVAMDVAGLTIISSDLTKIPLAIKLSDQTIKTVYQNLFWAFIYNAIGIPIAAGILYPIWGFMLNPMFAAAAMALSSVSVVANSLRLAGKKL